MMILNLVGGRETLTPPRELGRLVQTVHVQSPPPRNCHPINHHYLRLVSLLHVFPTLGLNITACPPLSGPLLGVRLQLPRDVVTVHKLAIHFQDLILSRRRKQPVGVCCEETTKRLTPVALEARNPCNMY